jgi:hypothetical protein
VTPLTVAGRGGVAGNATTAVLNVTVTDSLGDGYVTVFPCGSPLPLASTVNYVTGATAANGVVARIGAAGQVCLFTSNAAHLIVDVNGTFPQAAAFSSLVPARLMDTRTEGETVDGSLVDLGVRPGGSVIQVPVAGRGGVAADASAAVLNVTATESEGEGYVTVFPCGSPRPLASSVNFTAGVTVANAVVARIGAGGNVCLFVSVSTHLIVDVSGFFAWNGSGSGTSDSVDIPTSDDIPFG